MSDKEWLQNLKVGDTVIEDSGFRGKSISKVTRLTKTQIIVEEQNLVGKSYEVKYRRNDGFNIGGNIWSTNILREATPEAIAEIKEKQYRRAFQEKLNGVSWSDVPMETIKQIRELIEPYIKKKESK